MVMLIEAKHHHRMENGGNTNVPTQLCFTIKMVYGWVETCSAQIGPLLTVKCSSSWADRYRQTICF